jgi:hypothetical protein
MMWEVQGIVIDDVTSVTYRDVYFRCVNTGLTDRKASELPGH